MGSEITDNHKFECILFTLVAQLSDGWKAESSDIEQMERRPRV